MLRIDIMIRTVGALLALVLALLVFVTKNKSGDSLPQIHDKWWGDGQRSKENHHIEESSFAFPDQVITDLYDRLKSSRKLHPSHHGVGQRYGIRNNVMQKVRQYWINNYNWTERLKFINQYPHRFVKIRGLTIHFVYIKAEKVNIDKKVIPLLLVHGWPSSFIEFYDMIPMLMNPDPDRDFVFELVVPSLPGFAFSDFTEKPGLSAVYMAQILVDLMDILGYDHYYLHGGDWGGVVALHMAHRFPHKVLGMHCSMCYVNSFYSNLKLIIGRYLPSLIYEPSERNLCNSTANTLAFLLEESGYFHLQSTKPDTIGVALRDSPLGLAAYILEKFSTLTNAAYRYRDDAGLTEKFSMDRLLDNIMIYWISGCMTSAMRIYAEAFTNAVLEFNRGIETHVPTGCVRFANEILIAPRFILKERYRNLVHLTSYSRGGHFAAMEEPQLLASDISTFVAKVEKTRATKKST